MAAPRIAARFTGDPSTAFLEGLPARDLTEGEFEALSDEDKLRIAENAASPHAVYRLMPKEAKALAEQADQPAAADAPAEVGEPLTLAQSRAAEVAEVQQAAASMPPGSVISRTGGKPS